MISMERRAFHFQRLAHLNHKEQHSHQISCSFFLCFFHLFHEITYPFCLSDEIFLVFIQALILLPHPILLPVSLALFCSFHLLILYTSSNLNNPNTLSNQIFLILSDDEDYDADHFDYDHDDDVA